MDQVLDYYLLQKKIRKLTEGNYEEEENKVAKGYLLSSDIMSNWKRNTNYKKISDFLDLQEIDFLKPNSIKKLIKKYIETHDIKLSSYIFPSYFIIPSYRVLSQEHLGNLVNEKAFKFLSKKSYQKSFIEEKYIFKKNMLIIFFDDFNGMKIFLYSKGKNKLIDLSLNFPVKDYYKKYSLLFEKKSSIEILNILLKINIISLPLSFLVENNGDMAFKVFNEEEFYKYQKLNKGKSPDENNNKQNEIKEPHNIKFNLIDEISCRGLDNVGATCYMNATLQCLANIKPVTKYLLDPNNYCFLYNNLHLCLLTMEYIQVLIGLYCDDSRNGSYCPKNFKNIISEYIFLKVFKRMIQKT